MVFFNRPTPSISTSTVSPAFIHGGGVRTQATPPGVPVTITSPGARWREAGDVFDQLRHPENHHVERRRLHRIAVETGLNLLALKLAHLVGRHHEGTEGAGAGKILARRPLRGMPLVIAHRGVVVAGISRDMIQGVGRRDVTPALADDGDEFGFVIEIAGIARAYERLKMAHLRVGPTGEDRRVREFLHAGLVEMFMIVEADTDDLVRIDDRRIEGNLFEREIRRSAFRRALRLATRIGRDQSFEIGIFQAPRQIDHSYCRQPRRNARRRRRERKQISSCCISQRPQRSIRNYRSASPRAQPIFMGDYGGLEASHCRSASCAAASRSGISLFTISNS